MFEFIIKLLIILLYSPISLKIIIVSICISMLVLFNLVTHTSTVTY